MPREERWRRIAVSRSLRERKPEELTQLNTSFFRGSEVPFESQSVLANKVPTMNRFLEKERTEGEKESVLLSSKEEQTGKT